MQAPALDFAIDFDFDPVWHSLGGGACVAAAITLVRIGLDYAFRNGERRFEREDRRRAHQRDAEARLERVLQDRLAEADRRLERCDHELDTERERRFALERECAVLLRAYELLKEQCRRLDTHCGALPGESRPVGEPGAVAEHEPVDAPTPEHERERHRGIAHQITADRQPPGAATGDGDATHPALPGRATR
jgi:hypothetical protein